MARLPKPWFRSDRNCWFVTIGGVRHNLGPNKKRAHEKFHELMRAPKTEVVEFENSSFAVIADAFLEWVKQHRSPDTFEWYRYRIERFCQKYPDLNAQDLKPFHVQTWVDSTGSPQSIETQLHSIDQTMCEMGTSAGLLERKSCRVPRIPRCGSTRPGPQSRGV